MGRRGDRGDGGDGGEGRLDVPAIRTDFHAHTRTRFFFGDKAAYITLSDYSHNVRLLRLILCFTARDVP